MLPWRCRTPYIFNPGTSDTAKAASPTFTIGTITKAKHIMEAVAAKIVALVEGPRARTSFNLTNPDLAGWNRMRPAGRRD